MGASRPEAAFAADLASLLSVPTGAVDALDRIALAVFLTTFVALALQYREFCTPLDGVFIAVARALGSTCDTWQDFLDAHGPDFGVVRNSAALLVALDAPVVEPQYYANRTGPAYPDEGMDYSTKSTGSSIELSFCDSKARRTKFDACAPTAAEVLFRLEHFLVFE